MHWFNQFESAMKLETKKSIYFKSYFRGLMKNFFGNSAASLASFFTSSSDLSTEELKSLREMIDGEIKKKEK